MKQPSTWQRRLQWALEIFVILWFGLLFSAYFLASGPASETTLQLRGLDPNMRILALEHERLAGVLIPAQLGLGLHDGVAGIGRVPGWNPFMNTGIPLINDAFLYLFNPFISLPVLYLGAVQGTKIAIIINVMVAGINMWALGKAIGLGGVARVLIAAVYMMSGGIIGKYHNGHFQLAMSLAWPPLVFAGLWWTLNSRTRRSQALTAVAFALLFFSGNIYYVLHTLICSAVIFVAHAIPKFEWRQVRRVTVAGLLGLGLCTIQFLPVWSVRNYVSHASADFDDAGQLIGQYDLGQGIANFVTPWDTWSMFQNPPVNMWGAVDYAYIGPAIFALISGLIVLALFHNRIQVHHRRAAAVALLLAMIMMVWGAAQTEIVQELYRRVPLLSEFRFLGRANSIAALWWIVLAGVALDNLWRASRKALDVPDSFDAYDRVRLLRVLALPALAWTYLLVYTFGNNLTRLSMALNNVGLFIALDDQRFTSYPRAMEILINLTLAALVIDTVLLMIHQRFMVQPQVIGQAFRRMLGTRIIRLGLLTVAIIAISDVMFANYRIIFLGLSGDNFMPLYEIAHIDDGDTPFPSIQEPWSPSTFDAYYGQVRNWGLNEGWLPVPLENNLIPDGSPHLINLPGWAIASSRANLGGGYVLSQAFVEANEGVLRQCLDDIDPAAETDPDRRCGIEREPSTGLYQLPISLPYAFIAPENVLQTQADTLTGENTPLVPVTSHEMDTITLDITTPEGEPGVRNFLVIQETHFPGWQAFVDGVETLTISVSASAPGSFTTGFIGVPLQQGTHTYTLHFEPPGFKAGVIISAITVMITLLYLTGIRLPYRRTAAVTAPPQPVINPSPEIEIIPQPLPQAAEIAPQRRLLPGLLGLLAIVVTGAVVVTSRLWNRK